MKKDSPVKNKNLKSEDKPNFVISASSANSNRSSSYKKDEEIKNKKSSDYRKLNLPFVDSAPFPEEPFDIGSDRYVSKGNGTFGENKNTESTEKKIGSPIRLNDPVFPKYKIESNCRVCLQLTVNGNGEVINAKSTNSKTTCSGSSIIEEVIIQVIKQVKYSKDANSSISTKYITYLTVTLESE